MAKAHDLNIYKNLTYLLEKRPNKDVPDEQLELMIPWSKKVIDTCGIIHIFYYPNSFSLSIASLYPCSAASS